MYYMSSLMSIAMHHTKRLEDKIFERKTNHGNYNEQVVHKGGRSARPKRKA